MKTMGIKMLGAFVVAFLFSSVFGKYYIPWLKKRGATQPLKDEVAQIYKENSNDRNENS